MKKKILISMYSLHIGGAERSLIGLLQSINYKKYDVDLFLYRHEGEFLVLFLKKSIYYHQLNNTPHLKDQ